MKLAPGARLGPYSIVSALGAGGMGEVYRARDPRLARDVAIKVVAAAFAENRDRLARFEREARAAAALNHPNILAVYDVGTDAGAPFIVSELLEGETLRQRANGGPVAVRRAVEHAAQIARGLAAAHDKGIVHRDLKPENVFLTRDGQVKILDFGLVKLIEDQPSLASVSAAVTVTSPTHAGVVLGTVGYMAPEQLRGLPVDQRADIFALGAILYELLSGRRAFARDTAPETMTAILNDEPADLTPGVPTGLARIVSRCLEKDPAHRFQTARDLAFSLENASDTSSVATTAAASRARPSRLAWLAAGLALVPAAALTPIAYSHLRERPASLHPLRFQIPLTVEFGGPGNFSLSPDGRHLAFVGLGPDGVHRILGPRHGFARREDAARLRSECVHAAARLVARRAIPRVRRGRAAEEARRVRRQPPANPVRSTERCRGRLLESQWRHHRRQHHERPVPRARDWWRAHPRDRARSVAEGGGARDADVPS